MNLKWGTVFGYRVHSTSMEIKVNGCVTAGQLGDIFMDPWLKLIFVSLMYCSSSMTSQWSTRSSRSGINGALTQHIVQDEWNCEITMEL